MKTVIEYRYSYFTIFRIWGHAGSVWQWAMYHDELGDAAFFKGCTRIQRAYDKAIEGTVFQGFCEFRRASPHLSRYLQYQLCVNDVDTEWYCVHGANCTLEVSFVQLMGELMVPERTSLILLEGAARVRWRESVFELSDMHHFKPRPEPFRVHGLGKAFLVRRSGPLPTLSAPPGISDIHEAVAALRALV